MENYAITYGHIADILSFETAHDELKATLSDPAFDWDAIVIHSSKHLILPTIYCRLKSKNLLSLLPEDLVNYLQEITNLNRDRNRAILNQVQTITQLLNRHNIQHVYLKGVALLILECYEDIAERMIGDIDILLPESQAQKAFDLLCDSGYHPIEVTLGNHFFEHKHLPRLKTNKFIAAVEIHRKLFNSFTFAPLNPELVLRDKQLFNHLCIPSHEHLLMHNILNFQLSDHGAYFSSINFRSAYDSIVITRHQTLSSGKYDLNYFKSSPIKKYFNLLSPFFTDLSGFGGSRISLQTKFYLFKLKKPTFSKFWNSFLKLILYISNIIDRLKVFIINAAYRRAIINDKKRIYNHLKSFLKNL